MSIENIDITWDKKDGSRLKFYSSIDSKEGPFSSVAIVDKSGNIEFIIPEEKMGILLIERFHKAKELLEKIGI